MNNKERVFVDFPIQKKVTSKGQLKQFTNSDALMQAVKIWLACQKGEKIRTRSAGIVQPYIAKTLDEDNASELKRAIQYDLENFFDPNLTIVYLDVKPNIEKSRWEISLIAYNEELSIGINDKVMLANR